MKITVIGCGRWGSFVAWYLNSIGHDVTLYGRETSEKFNRILSSRSNGMLDFDKNMRLTSDFAAACESPVIVISVNSQNLRELIRSIADMKVGPKVFVLCMKGIEADTKMRLSQIVEEEYIKNEPDSRVAVWLGPGHVQDLSQGIPSCMVIDSDDDFVKKTLVDEFSSKLIRFYYGGDLVGNEIGAATKNIIGIAAGMLDAINMSALKGALTTRGAYEVSRLIHALGGNPISAYGLCHFGDYAATVFSKHSQNRRFGEAFVRGEKYDKLAEGYFAVKPVVELAYELDVQMPICQAVYDVLYNDMLVTNAIESLFARDIKSEIYT